jgi:hypothetical protein
LGSQNIAQTAIFCVVASDITAERVAESYRMSNDSQTMAVAEASLTDAQREMLPEVI